MLLFAVSDPSTETASYKREHIRNLRVILARQLEDLTELSTIIGYLNGFKEVGIDRLKERNTRRRLSVCKNGSKAASNGLMR